MMTNTGFLAFNFLLCLLLLHPIGLVQHLLLTILTGRYIAYDDDIFSMHTHAPVTYTHTEHIWSVIPGNWAIWRIENRLPFGFSSSFFILSVHSEISNSGVIIESYRLDPKVRQKYFDFVEYFVHILFINTFYILLFSSIQLILRYR